MPKDFLPHHLSGNSTSAHVYHGISCIHMHAYTVSKKKLTHSLILYSL